MSTLTRSRYREVPANAAEQLVGSLGGTAVVPFYYNRLYNLNRDGSGNIIQWADAIRGYVSPAPPVLAPGGAVAPTYDATKGVVFSATTMGLSGALSTAFAPSAGSVLGGITTQRLGAYWVVGEIDAAASSGKMLQVYNGATTDQVALATAGGGGTAYSMQASGTGGSSVVNNTVVADGTRRLIIVTVVTGNNEGVQVPTHGALVQTSLNQGTRTTEPYAVQLFAGLLGPAAIGSVAEFGGLLRSPTASDLTLLQNNAVSVHGATL